MSEEQLVCLPLRLSVVLTICQHDIHVENAVSSVLNQTAPIAEVLVVDSSPTSAIETIVPQAPNIRYIHRPNANLAAARNIGIAETNSECLLFLNSNDFLLPNAVQTGLCYLEKHSEVDVVLFDFQWTDDTGNAAWRSGRRPFLDKGLFPRLLTGELVFAHSSTFYRRRAFDRIGQFRSHVSAASDRDLLLRAAAQSLTLVADSTVVAKCRPSLASSKEMMTAVRTSLSQVDLTQYPAGYHDLRRKGIAAAENAYGELLWNNLRSNVRRGRWNLSLLKELGRVGAACPSLVARELGRFLRHSVGKHVYSLAGPKQKQIHLVTELARLQLKGATGVSDQFGFDRGQPIDRYYIERFLARKSIEIRGRVLEVSNNRYTTQFGGSRVTQSDVLHPDPAWAEATIHADLTDSAALPDAIFDCVILTQTLHLIYDVRAVLRTISKALSPGGTLLITAPSLSRLYHLNEPSYLNLDQDSWRFTRWSFGKLLSEFFPLSGIEVNVAGNLAANTAFLYGLAVEEMPPGVLDQIDEENEMLILASAVK